MLSPNEIKRRAIEFSREHADDHNEKSQAQNFLRDFFAIWDLKPSRIGTFEERARLLTGNRVLSISFGPRRFLWK